MSLIMHRRLVTILPAALLGLGLGSPIAVAQTTTPGSDDTGPDLYFEFAGGASMFAGTASLSTAIDLDSPTENTSDPKFRSAIGTALSIGTGVKLTDALSLGVEGSLIGHNAAQSDVTANGKTNDLDANSTALGALVVGSYALDLGSDFALETTAGLGYFRNTTNGTLKVTEGGTTTSQTFEDHTRFGLGYSVGAGLSYAPTPENSFGVEYRFQDAGVGNSGHSKTASDSAAIDFGSLQSHQILFGVTFTF